MKNYREIDLDSKNYDAIDGGQGDIFSTPGRRKYDAIATDPGEIIYRVWVSRASARMLKLLLIFLYFFYFAATRYCWHVSQNVKKTGDIDLGRIWR